MIQEKIKIELGNVQKTLLLPLWGRAVETQKKKPLLIDITANDLVNKLDYDFSTLSENINEGSQVGWIARSIHIDRTVKKFLEKHPRATIVNIGCGLDTTFDRVDNGSILWYELDMPDVIALRSKLIPESERRKYISSSFLDTAWLDQLIIEDNILFIAAGIFYYFEEFQIKEFLIKIAELFPDSEIVFDTTSPLGVKTANQMVIKRSGMDENSFLRWGIKSAKKIENWDRRIKILEEYPLFFNIRKSNKFENRIKVFLYNALKISLMVHLRL